MSYLSSSLNSVFEWKESKDFKNNHGVNFLIFIGNLSEPAVNCNDIELASKVFHNVFTKRYGSDLFFYERILNSNSLIKYIYIENYRINISDHWLFHVILLGSIKNLKVVKQNDNDYARVLTLIVYSIMKYCNTCKRKSAVLLHSLEFILTKCTQVLTHTLCWQLLKFTNKLALSPLRDFKRHANCISRIAISHLTWKEAQLLWTIHSMPIQGVETKSIAKMYSNSFIQSHITEMIKLICKMFENNIEGKDAAVLYERLLSVYSFDKWKEEIWPHFYLYLVSIYYEGEFSQNFIKHWIPLTVNVFQIEFYLFVKQYPINFELKAYILLETRKKGQVIGCEDHLTAILNNIETVDLGLEIVSTYYKKSICPSHFEISAVAHFLYSNVNSDLNEYQLKSFKKFISQLFLFAHNDLKKSKNNFNCYLNFINTIYNYFCAILNTELFEVGIQILCAVLDVLKGAYNKLSLGYNLEKQDMYEAGKNMLYVEITSNKLWNFDKEEFVLNIKHRFLAVQGSSKDLAYLIIKHYPDKDIINVEVIESIFGNVQKISTLKNIEKISNCSMILQKTNVLDKNNTFIYKMQNSLLENFRILSTTDCEKVLYTSTLYLSILSNVDCETSVEHYGTILKEAFAIIQRILNKDMENYNPSKIVEAFINNVIHCFMQNLEILWNVTEKEYILMCLIHIIEKSNMKRCVTQSFEALKQMGRKTEENQEEKVLKIRLLSRTLMKLYNTPLKSTLKIRRNPETRLIIHALCSSETNSEMGLLQWVLQALINILCNKNSSDTSLAAALHSVELIVSDNNLQSHIFHYFCDIIKCSIEVFIRPNWIVRNADLQLIKALIERLYGVSLGPYNRPKNVENLLILFPSLPVYFYRIFSLKPLDDRATVVFQFFLESQVKQNILDLEIQEILDNFKRVFVHIIKHYQNQFGKLSVLSYCSLCPAENILEVFYDITTFLKTNFKHIKKNILTNYVMLLKELYSKYENSVDNIINPKELLKINYLLKDLILCLRQYDKQIFDFLLLKVESFADVVNKISQKDFNNLFVDRIWLHNNLPFLVLNAPNDSFDQILEVSLSKKVSDFMHIKVLCILIYKFENGNFKANDLCKILKVLFKCSMGVDDTKMYMLSNYYKIILLLGQYCKSIEINEHINLNQTSNMYKIMICVIYSCLQNNSFKAPNLEYVWKSAEHICFNLKLPTDEVNNDIMAMQHLLLKTSPKNMLLKICKLIVNYSFLLSTYQEAYYCMLQIIGKRHGSILAMLKEFLFFMDLQLLGKDELTVFFRDVKQFLEFRVIHLENNTFYDTDSDNVIPFDILHKLLHHLYVKHSIKY